ncbi:MAG: aspartate/tyrosine/aromatic aminotransferase [Chlamydiia bacterium]|nr:aspartate/tyrosine/aromatic aminotransferase [Chlamydiia bacterium]
MSFFENLEKLPPDPIFGLVKAFSEDHRKTKVNLGVGQYQTAELKPFILNTVKKAEAHLLEEEYSKNYLPIDGEPSFIDLTKKLVFGEEEDLSRIYGAQTVGGTAALNVGGHILYHQGIRKIYTSSPTWVNHNQIFSYIGFEIFHYPYWDEKQRTLDFTGFLDAIQEMPPKSALVLQGCCHNPTGVDPTLNQWEEIIALLKKRQVFPIVDFAYQGFGDGVDKDAAAISLFLKNGIEFFVTASYSKNFGLYAERTGALFCVTQGEEIAECVGDLTKMIIRRTYSNPPCHGGRIVVKILSDAVLRKKWEKELGMMRERIIEMRKSLVTELIARQTTDFSYIANQKGMFSFTGLDSSQVEQLINDYGIYLPKNGRINVAGLNTSNLPFIAEAICSV